MPWFIFDIHANPPRVVEWDNDRYILELQRSVLELINVAKEHDENGHPAVDHAKELIRCRVLQCGLGGACSGQGSREYPCPLRRDLHLTAPVAHRPEGTMVCGCPNGSHPAHSNMLEGAAERDSRVCKLGWAVR